MHQSWKQKGFTWSLSQANFTSRLRKLNVGLAWSEDLWLHKSQEAQETSLKPKDYLRMKKANSLSELTCNEQMLNPFETHSKIL